MKTCDNTSVDVIITNADGQYLMFDRNTFPPGTAPAAGHVDDHGSLLDAARAEVEEELGLHVESLQVVAQGWRPNRCRRLPGELGVGHAWAVYAATVTGELAPSARETKNVRWIPGAHLQGLADRTVAYAHGHLSDADFATGPGIEPVWVQWLVDLEVISVILEDLERVDQLAAACTPKEQPDA
jgi:8-oxo-dGTP pyrophosphatase MutT (NUDIX family)